MTTIIGFTNTLENPPVPRILDPVYFIMYWDTVIPTHKDGIGELESSLHITITTLKYPIKFKKGYVLWVNHEGAINYSRKEDVERIFKLTYNRCLELAEEGLAKQQPWDTKRFAQISRSINPRTVEPLLLKGVTEFYMYDATALALTLHQGSSISGAHEFNKQFNELMFKYPNLEIK